MFLMHDPGTDPLSALARTTLSASTYDALVVTATPQSAFDNLGGVTPEQLLAVPVADPVAAQAMLAALWLWHDALDECHRIVQKSPAELRGRSLGVLGKSTSDEEAEATLAFWHAIMHRREGDFSNSKYWYARCQNHRALTVIAAQANPVLNPLPADKSILRLTHTGWNPNAFVDLVEQQHQNPDDPRYRVTVALQKLEWRILFDHCVRAASGGEGSATSRPK
jgi:hypothetical protein